MSFTNITDEELVGMGVTGLPDTPGLTTEEMQAQFDEYSVFLKDKFKGLIAELEATTAALSIGADVPENITAEGNIQSILEGLRDYVDATVVALGTGDMARGIYDPDRDGVIAPAQGGTGLTSLQATRNAMGLGDTTGALPIANGGTGQTTEAGIRNALGLGNTTGALPLANGGTGASTAIEALINLGLYQYFVSNNNIEPTTTAANHHNVGDFIVYDNSKKFAKVTAEINIGDTITHGTNVINEPIGAELTNMKATFQAGVDTIYDAIVAEGVTPANSTPEKCAEGIAKMESDVYDAIVAKGVTPAADTIPGCVSAIPNVYTKGKTDAEAVTWTEYFQVTAYGNYNTFRYARVFMELKDVVKIVFNNIYSATCSWKVCTQKDYYLSHVSREGTASSGTTIQSFTSSEKFLYIEVYAPANTTGAAEGYAEATITRQAKVLR